MAWPTSRWMAPDPSHRNAGTAEQRFASWRQLPASAATLTAMLPDLSTEAAFKTNVVAEGPLPARSQEGRRWELKEQKISVEKAAIQLASLANTVGGTLIVGVGETEVAGVTYAEGIHDVPDADKYREQVLGHCDARLKPVPIGESFPLMVDGKAVVVFQVEPSVRIVAYQDGDRLKYPYRDSHGTKYMDAARVEMHIMDENKSKHLRFLKSYETAKGPVKVVFVQQANLWADDSRLAGPEGFARRRSSRTRESYPRRTTTSSWGSDRCPERT